MPAPYSGWHGRFFAFMPMRPPPLITPDLIQHDLSIILRIFVIVLSPVKIKHRSGNIFCHGIFYTVFIVIFLISDNLQINLSALCCLAKIRKSQKKNTQRKIRYSANARNTRKDANLLLFLHADNKEYCTKRCDTLQAVFPAIMLFMLHRFFYEANRK